jgi:6-phosphogluconolactonase
MADVRVKTDLTELAGAAAELTVEVLRRAIANRGQANWLLAGGTAPMGAYRLLANAYRTQVDWSKVYVAIGDERCVPFDSPVASWPLIDQALLQVVSVPTGQQLRPKSDLPAEAAAIDYEEQLNRLIAEDDSVPHFDMVWLGMGEDGHTLSLFPDNPGLKNTEPLVVPVHDSPKPPPDRISLTLRALKNTANCLVMSAGSGKSAVIGQIFNDGATMPIKQAVDTIEAASGQVTWLFDQAAATQLNG